MNYKELFLKEIQDAQLPMPSHGIGCSKPELKFMNSRNWRFDYCYEDLKIAIEYQGIGRYRKKSKTNDKTGHNTITGQTRDWNKANEAQIRGWLVLFINAKTVQSGEAIWYLQRAMRYRLQQDVREGKL